MDDLIRYNRAITKEVMRNGAALIEVNPKKNTELFATKNTQIRIYAVVIEIKLTK